jgi:6-phosphogluconate dehydrogenase
MAGEGATGAESMEDFVRKLSKPRAAWVMVPAGAATEATVMKLAGLMEAGDTIIDGGNSYFKDDIRRAAKLREQGLHYVDVGTSGGVWGFERGYCMMLGGPKEAVERLDPLFKTLAPGMGDALRTAGREGQPATSEQGYLHCGPSGSGHFVKMIHNGIEYGLMQAYAEGFDIMKHANSAEVSEDHRFDLNLTEIAEVWRRGSVVDHHGSDRRSRPLRCSLGIALHPVPLPPGPYLCGEDPVGDAQQVWRPRGAPRRRIVHLIGSIFSKGSFDDA